jgi:hypothetical protein
MLDRDGGLLGKRLGQLHVPFPEGAATGRVGHQEGAEHGAADGQGREQGRADPARSRGRLPDPLVSGGVGHSHRLAGLDDLARDRPSIGNVVPANSSAWRPLAAPTSSSPGLAGTARVARSAPTSSRAWRPNTQVLMLTSFAGDQAGSPRSWLAPPTTSSSRSAAATWSRPSAPSAPARACWIRPSLRACWTGSARASTCSKTNVWPACPPGGTHPGAGRGRPHQQADRRGAPPGREDGQELRLQHPGQARGHPPGRGGLLPDPPHHHARQLVPACQHPSGRRCRPATISGPLPQGGQAPRGPAGRQRHPARHGYRRPPPGRGPRPP